MSVMSERVLRSEAEGYWAVEVRLAQWAGQGRRYLCHGENDRDARRIAGRLMGSGGEVRGYDYYRIDEPMSSAILPAPLAMGGHAEIRTPAQWTGLMDAHRVSEAAYAARLDSQAAHAA